jgi:hypothetical protein
LLQVLVGDHAVVAAQAAKGTVGLGCEAHHLHARTLRELEGRAMAVLLDALESSSVPAP